MLPPIVERQTINIGSWDLPEQRFKSRDCHKNQYWGRRTGTGIDKMLKAQCGQLRVLKTPDRTKQGLSPILKFTFQEFGQVLTVNTKEKSPPASCKEK